MALTMSSRIVMRGIGCTLTLLLVLSAQAIDYEVHRHDVIPTNLNNDLILTSRDLLNQLNLVARKASYTLQEGTEHLLYFGALLRARILDIFGNLLYIYYDDFSIAEVEALHKVYQEVFDRQYDIFNLIPHILKNSDTRPSKICAAIYTYAEPCLKNSASLCRRIRKQHDLPHPDDFDTPALNVTYLIYRLSKIPKRYPRGFSPAELLKLMQREVLTITPYLLSGLLYNVRYDNFDDDVRLAERELVRYFREVAQSTRIPVPLPIRELKKFRSVNSLLKYYISVYAEKLPDDLKRHAYLIAKRIADEIGTIDENIHLLGNIYENRTINIGYLFNLVLPDDLLDIDVIEAKRYLVNKLDEFYVVERYLRVQKYQQATPAQLTMEITGQLQDIDFAKSIAMSLRMHAKFWRKSRMIESLDELLELFDAYENLRQVPRYLDMMQKIDRIRESLWDMKDVPVEILCNAPRACLRIGLQFVLHCKFVSSEIKKFIRDFLKMSDVCVIPAYAMQESRRSVDIPFMISKVRLTTKMATTGTTRKIIEMETTKTEPMTTSKATSVTEDYDQSETMKSSESEESTESVEISNETAEDISVESEMSLEKSTEFMNTTIIPTTTESISMTHQEETTAASTSTVATTTTTTSPTITTLPLTTTILSTTTTTILPVTTTLLSTTTKTSPTTITTALPKTTITTAPTTAITTLPTTTTTTLPITTTTLLPTTISTILPTSTTTTTTTTTASPRTTTEVPTIDMEIESKIVTNVPKLHNDDEVIKQSLTTSTLATMRSCESNECINEPNSEEINEHVETTTTSFSTTQSLISTTTPTPTIQTSTLETARTTSPEPLTISQELVTSETTITPTTELSETPITKSHDCVKTSCSEGCRSKSESIEMPVRRPCEISCDSVMEDCDEKDSGLEDVSEKMENYTTKCPTMRCDEDSSEVSSECETEIDKSCGCVSNEEGNAGCVTLCPSDVESSSCEEDQDNCSRSDMPTVDLKYERIRKHGLCEIRDPHHRRQMKRLAKMRAISADILKSRPLRRRDQIATKKLYKLLAAKLPRSKDDRSSRIAEYLLKRPFSKLSKIEGGSRKRRKQQEQIYRLRRKLTRELGRKLIGEMSMHRSKIPLRQSQTERIFRKDAKSIETAMRKKAMRNLSI